jgi:hypothetical protein
MAVHRPETKKQSAATMAAHPSIPKPSAAIAKQQANASSD